MVKIGLKRIDIVEALLDSRTMELVTSLEFAQKQGFKLKKIKRLIYIYMRNVDGSLNKEKPIKYIVEVNIYYQEYKERTEINIVGS